MRSFEELLEENKGSAEAYVKYKASSREDAEDILQDTYVQAFNSFQFLEKEDSFRSWLITIARNNVTDYYRRKARICEVPLDEQIAVYTGPGRTVHYQVQDTMALLSDEERRVLLLYYWEELSVKEIAEKLSIPEGTVKSRLHNARKSFEKKYSKEEMRIMKLPEEIFEYKIEKTDQEPFSVIWEELMGWFLVPREGNKCSFALYDFPERTKAEQIDLKCGGKAEIHGLTGVKVDVTETQGKEKIKRKFVAQLTDTHCRYLAEAHEEDGVEKVYTFLDGNAFLNNWGFGPDNIGNEIHLSPKGLIRREGNSIITDSDREVMDVVGRYLVTINGKTYDTVCLMDIGTYDENTISEQYIDRNGRTVLWRRFNKKNWRWNFDHHEQILDEKLKDNESITVNGVECHHWYDCITDYIL